MNDTLIAAFALSVVLLGIHSFFGLEIIKRGIIFTDLAIGQMSALGAAISLLFFHGEFLYPISLGFALLGGLVISFASRKTDKLEAFIGLLYAFGLSGVIIVLANAPHGNETLKKLMASDILYTPPAEILKVALIYALLGIAIFVFYKKLQGFLKDMFFFVIFAATVTSSVKVAGVLIVFALLVAPALIAMRIGRGNSLVLAWITGTVVNLAAIIVSYVIDLPTGYTIVFCQSLIAILVILFLPTKKTVAEAQQ